MLKNEFKLVRSNYRKCLREAYLSATKSSFDFREQAKEFSKVSIELSNRFSSDFGINFQSLSKPDERVNIVSLKVFSALDFPFEKIKRPTFN